MLSSFKFVFQGLRAATLLGLLVCGIQSVANAGVLTYTAGTGGTFDPSTASTFTFTNFGVGTLSAGVTYTDVRVLAKWNTPGTYPGAFSITGLSLSSPATNSAFSNIDFGAATNANNVRPNGFVTLNTPVIHTGLGPTGVSLTLIIPSLNVSDGWNLSFALDFTDDPTQQPGSNTNATAYQTVSALNGGSSVPEPGTTAVAGGLFALAIFVQRRRAKRTANVDSTTV